MKTPPHHLLPAKVRSPLFLALVWLVPQAVLLVLNLRAWWLVGGEMTPDQIGRMRILVGMEIGLLVLGAALCIGLWLKRLPVHWLWSIPMLLLHVIYLWTSFVWGPNDILPVSTSLWILPPQRFLFQQFALIMPGAFYAGTRLACFPRLLRPSGELGISFVSCILFPAIWYGVLVGISFTGSALRNNISPQVTGFVLGGILVVATVITLAAMLRFIVLLYHFIRTKGDNGMVLFCLLVGLIGPVAGLILNRAIPFPFDFQAPVVYGFAVVNGILLTLPPSKNRWLHRIHWLLLCALSCYVAYFFLVFLPFLPLSLLAMIAMLAGLLMLIPTVLFALQGLRVVDGYKREVRELGRLPATALLLFGLLIVPSFFVGRAMMHRTTLHQAIAYVYEQDPTDPSGFAGHLGMLKRSLSQMHRTQHGFELPFLTTAYNQIVFDGLTLPDSKLQRIHRTFFGDELKAEPTSNGIIGELGFMPSPRNVFQNFRKNPPPSTDVKLKKMTWTRFEEGDCTRAVAKLEMGFSGGGIREFVESIELPEGVFVSGFWLHVGKERVPGRIFEKNAALWVYQMIRDTSPRDPGLLLYTDPTHLDLRVYPVEGGADRVVEVEFLFPTGMDPALEIGGHKWPRGERSKKAKWLRGADEGLLISLPDQAPRIKRSPYLHFILDRSSNARPLAHQLEDARKIATEKHVDDVMVTLANFEARSLFDEANLQPATVLVESTDLEDLEVQGGFLRGRMIQRVLLMHDERSVDSETWGMRTPHVVVIQDTESPVDEELDWFLGLCPDARIEVWRNGVQQNEFSGVAGASSVCVIRSGDRTRALAGSVGWLPANADGLGPEWMKDGNFVEIDGEVVRSERYAQGVGAWTRHFERSWRGSGSGDDLSAMVETSRKTGILLPDTSYIVVENSAQWNMLKLKEDEKLDANEQFEFDAPAPGVLWLVLPWLAFLAWRRRASDGK